MSCVEGFLDVLGFWRAVPCDLELRVMNPDGGVTLWVGVGKVSNLVRIVHHAHRRCGNVYYGVNPRFRGQLGGRAAVKACTVLHVDVDGVSDVGVVLARVDDVGLPEPTIVVSSGGGCHVYWRLREPELELQPVEDANARLAHVLGGDHCWDASRVLRLPGTTNFPCGRKRALGRKPVPVEVQHVANDVDGSCVSSIEVNALLDDVPLPQRNAAALSDVPDTALHPDLSSSELDVGRACGYGRRWRDRSGADWELAVDAFFRGADDVTVARLLWHAPWGKAREAGIAYLRRTMERAKAHALAELEALGNV